MFYNEGGMGGVNLAAKGRALFLRRQGHFERYKNSVIWILAHRLELYFGLWCPEYDFRQSLKNLSSDKERGGVGGSPGTQGHFSASMWAEIVTPSPWEWMSLVSWTWIPWKKKSTRSKVRNVRIDSPTLFLKKWTKLVCCTRSKKRNRKLILLFRPWDLVNCFFKGFKSTLKTWWVLTNRRGVFAGIDPHPRGSCFVLLLSEDDSKSPSQKNSSRAATCLSSLMYTPLPRLVRFCQDEYTTACAWPLLCLNTYPCHIGIPVDDLRCMTIAPVTMLVLFFKVYFQTIFTDKTSTSIVQDNLFSREIVTQ